MTTKQAAKVAALRERVSESHARLEKAHRLRATGKTWKEVGEACGVSAGYAQAQAKRYERITQYEPGSCPFEGLSVRACNGLRAAGVITREDLEAASDGTLLRVPNFGRGTLAEVRMWQATR